MNFQDPILTEAKKDFQYLLELGHWNMWVTITSWERWKEIT